MQLEAMSLCVGAAVPEYVRVPAGVGVAVVALDEVMGPSVPATQLDQSVRSCS